MRIRLVVIPRLRGWFGISHLAAIRTVLIFPAPFIGVSILYGGRER